MTLPRERKALLTRQTVLIKENEMIQPRKRKKGRRKNSQKEEEKKKRYCTVTVFGAVVCTTVLKIHSKLVRQLAFA